MITRLLKSKLFPGLLQRATVALLLPTLVLLLFGTPDRSNPANLFVWMCWWPLLVALFLVAGRVWCSLCPFTFVGSWVQRLVGLQRPVPELFKQHGPWMITIALVLLFWLEEAIDAVDVPRATAVVLLSILSGAVISGLFFRGRAWCRYVCPLGGISLVYSRVALLKVRSSESACAECLTKDCVVPDSEYAGCPMGLAPFAIDSVSSCTFCGSCVKRCTNQSMRVSFEAPSLDLLAQPSLAPAAVWMTVLLAAHLSFVNTLQSLHLPVAAAVQASTNPILLKTLLMAASTTFWSLLFDAVVRLAAGAGSGPSRTRLLQLGALPMIPMVLLSHIGHLSGNIWANVDHVQGFLARATGIVGLRAEPLSRAAWTGFFNPASIAVGLLATLWVSGWVLSREPETPAPRVRWYFGLLYALYACWNSFTTWPAAGPGFALPRGLHRAAGGTSPEHGWEVLWPFLGVNAALLALVLVVRRSEQQCASDAKDAELSANRTWVVRDTSGAAHQEILAWLVEQAVHAKWRIPAVVGLANAGAEVVAFLQRTLSDGSPITGNAILRKKKGVMTIFHEGRPLNLPEFKKVTSLEDNHALTMEGLELRLAQAHVEQMHYQARLSDGRCCFTLLQSC